MDQESERGKGAAHQRRRRARLRAAGLCLTCGKEPEPGRKYCRPCLDRHSAGAVARRQGLKAQGICYQCSTRPVRERGAPKCVECAARETSYLREMSERWDEQGLCTMCGRERDGGEKRC